MSKNVLKQLFIKEIIQVCSNLYRKGWAERNGGNISYLLDDFDIKSFNLPKKRTVKIDFDASILAGKYFAITGTGKYFKNVEADPENHIGIIKVSDDSKSYDIIWGLNDNSLPTSELPAHFSSHIVRLKKDKKHRIILHTHATHTIAMTMSHELDEVQFTKTLWSTMSECAVVFPEGVGIIPWMVPGSIELGKKTAEKLNTYRVVVWESHGVFGTGRTMDETFGLVETVEKSAEIYTHMCSQMSINFQHICCVCSKHSKDQSYKLQHDKCQFSKSQSNKKTEKNPNQNNDREHNEDKESKNKKIGITNEQILQMEPQFGFKIDKKFLEE